MILGSATQERILQPQSGVERKEMPQFLWELWREAGITVEKSHRISLVNNGYARMRVICISITALRVFVLEVQLISYHLRTLQTVCEVQLLQ